MNRHRTHKLLLLAAAALLLPAFAVSHVPAQQPDRAPDERGIEVLARGPVHEAFAEPIVFNPTAGITVQTQPPDPVPEMPPEQKPAGRHVTWIPGYWGWDEERDNFLWVSGFWRTLPPGREWMPGYWHETGDGWQWVSGFWGDARADQIQYLPPPPENLEYGPTTPAPADNYFWTPGCWSWVEYRYRWRPGYWVPVRQDWIWVPDYFVWTPRGYVFVDGYWDYALPRRGILFAPVYYHTPLYAQAGYFYSPTIVVDIGVLTAHFFIWPQHNHYYFGDYYAAGFGNQGVLPWFAFASSRRGYDPIYAHYRTRHAHADRNWETRLNEDFRFRQQNENARPARTAALAATQVGRGQVRGEADRPLVQPLAQLAAATGTAAGTQLNLERIDRGRRQQLAEQAKETREFTKQRVQLESKAAPTATPITPAPADQTKKDATPKVPDAVPKGAAKPDQPSVEVKRPKSPIAGPTLPPQAQPGATPTTPVTPGTPKVPSKVESKTPKDAVPEVPKTPKVEPKVPKDATPKPLPTPKVEPQPPAVTPPAPKPAPKVEPKPPPTPPTVPTPAPKVQPKPPVAPPIVPAPAPKVQPKPPVTPPSVPTPAPKVEPKPPVSPPSVPKVETKPRVAPPVTPTPAPRVEPKPQPAPQPTLKPPPRVEPKPQPAPSPPPRVEPKPPKGPAPGGGGGREGGKEKKK